MKPGSSGINASETMAERSHHLRSLWMEVVELQKRIIELSVCSLVGLIPFVIALLSCKASIAEITPPKGQIVYSAQVSQEEYTHDTGRYDLFMRLVPEGKVIRITNHQTNPKQKLGGAIRQPRFSPDGRELIFLADYADSPKELRETMTDAAPYPYTLLNVWLLQIDSRNIHPITKGELGWREAKWSPKGRYFCAVYPSRAGVIDQDVPIADDVYVWDVRAQQKSRLIRVADGIADIFWSGDGESILYQTSKSPNLYAIPRRGGKPKPLIVGNGQRLGYSFSPDGKQVAFVQDGTLYLADGKGDNVSPILRPMEPDAFDYQSYTIGFRPQWSEDGKALAIAEVSHDKEFTSFKSRLHVIDTRTKEDRVIAIIPENTAVLNWSKDIQWLIVKTLRAKVREGLVAASISDGKIVTLMQPDEVTKGLDWVEIQQ